jgi:hypothetical protein
MTISVNDCNSKEIIENFFEKSLNDFQNAPANRLTDIILLNSNTQLLNREIIRFRKIKLDVIKSKPLTATARIEFQTKYIPDSLKSEFRNRVFGTVGDLAKYVESKNELNSILSSSDAVANVVSQLEPRSYLSLSTLYPLVEERLIAGGAITSAEVENLSRTYGLDQNRLSNNITDNIGGTLSLLQRLFSGMGLGLGLMGSLCSLMNNVFGVNTGAQDILGNASSFGGDLTNIISSISPQTEEMMSTIQSITGLVQQAQEAASDMQISMQEAFQLLANAMNITMSFFDQSTGTPGGVEIPWDFVKIKEAIELGITNVEPEKTLFITTLIENRPLADFNDDGVVNSSDTTLLQQYIDNTLANITVLNYINGIMIPHMTRNISDYKDYTLYSSTASNSSESDISEVVNSLSQAANMFGTSLNPSGGDFGQSEIQNMLSSMSNIQSSISSLVSNLRNNVPVNIDSILSQINEVRDMGRGASDNIFSDMRTLLQQFRQSSEEALAVAEALSVTDPQRTRDIQEARQTAIGENVTRTLNLSARTTSDIVPVVGQRLTDLETLLRSSAATGIINSIEERLVDVVEQSASRLQTVTDTLSPESLDNGFNFNMQSSFARFAGLQSRARLATEQASVEHVQDVVRGQIADSTTGFRDLNRENVEFIALRFCNMAGEIERLYNSFTDPLQQMIEQASSTNQRLEGVGSEVSLGAIRAGAIRFPSSARPAAAQTAAIVTATVAAPYVAPSGNRTTIPPAPQTPTDVGYGPVTFPPEDYSNLPRYQDVFNKIWRGLFRYSPGPRSEGSVIYNGLPPSAGWDALEREVLIKLVRLARQWVSNGNPPFSIASAYRAGITSRQLSLYRNTPRNQWKTGPNNGLISPSSLRIESTYHARRKAVDCAIGGNRQKQQQFFNLARSVGFKGVSSPGTYTWGVHVDIGPERTW